MLFPGGRLPLRIFEARYMDMAKTCLKDGSPFGVCLIVQGREVGEPATPAPVGTLATIKTWDMPQLGLLHILALGGSRFRIHERRVQRDGLARASIEVFSEDLDAPVAEDFSNCRKLLERVIAQQPSLFEPPHRLDSCAWLGARLAEILPLPLEMKQELLELTDARQRLEKLTGLLKA